jgi:exopolyphosphatase/guanosine-5'-triphosphate,3'-diphosphate pyrophosphatase
MPTAAIDLGSNSATLLVLDDAGDTLLDQGLVVGLGRGLGDGGTFAPDRIHRAIEVLATYAARASYFGVDPGEVRAIATSAARRATDAEDFFTRLQRGTGLRFRIVPGEREAQLSWLGATSGREGPVLMVDIGGGSTELAWGVAGGPAEGRRSLEVGTVRLTEAVFDEVQTAAAVARAQAHVRALLADLPSPSPCAVVGVAGTAMTLAALQATPDAERLTPALHGTEMGVVFLRDTRASLLDLDEAGRRARVRPAPNRARYLVAGTVIAEAVLAWVGVDRWTGSARDLRHGALAEASAGRLPPGPDRLA